MSEQPERRWLPADWMDEINPWLGPSPDAYIERVGDGWGLRLPEETDPVDRENEFYQMAVEPGQIVQFNWTESYGTLTLTVYRDRTWGTDFSAPAKATHFYEYSSGALAESIGELVAGDEINEALDPGEYAVDAYTWSERVAFRFEVDEAGNGRFVEIGMVH